MHTLLFIFCLCLPFLLIKETPNEPMFFPIDIKVANTDLLMKYNLPFLSIGSNTFAIMGMYQISTKGFTVQSS